MRTRKQFKSCMHAAFCGPSISYIIFYSGPKNKRRKGKNRRHGSRDRRDYYEDSGSSHGIPASRDTRYNDMAPK